MVAITVARLHMEAARLGSNLLPTYYLRLTDHLLRACTWKQLVSPAVVVRAPAPRTTQPAAWHRPGSTSAVSGTLTWVRVRVGVGVGVRARVRTRARARARARVRVRARARARARVGARVRLG